MEDEGGEEPPAPGTEEDAPLKPLLRPAASSSQVSGSAGSQAKPGLGQSNRARSATSPRGCVPPTLALTWVLSSRALLNQA